uniref:Biogenesis of lysosome-related organelles complex 1 subunit 3 n=1 Tax=Culex tarsalis TaxID=7177 RepID=A0A1Q3FJP7_CULTA
MDLKTPNIVPGEASETDDEDEKDGVKIIIIENGPNAPPQIEVSPQRKTSLGDAEEALEQSVGLESDIRQLQLQQIINERCISLLNEFIHTTAVSVSKQLLETDNLLMKSQVVLQNTTVTVKKINDSTELVASKLHDVLSFNFIPKIENLC